MEAVAHKVSFATNGRLREFPFVATRAEADAFLGAIPRDARQDVCDFQVMAFSTAAPGTCTELVDVMLAAAVPAGMAQGKVLAARQEEMRAAAAAVDAAAASTVDLVAVTASFVWDNGGDDNAFEQDFKAPERHPAVAAFAEAMKTAMAAFAYDINLGIVPDPTPDMTLDTVAREVADVLEEEECDDLANAVRAARPANAPAP